MDLFIENETGNIEPEQYGDEIIAPVVSSETNDTVVPDEQPLPQFTR